MHLNVEELVDLAEGARDDSSLAHVTTCERCRQQLADLRAALGAAASADVPEPSPLFWDHLSNRVREAVATEGAPAGAGWWNRWPRWASSGALPVWLGALAAVVLAVVLTSRMAPLPGWPAHAGIPADADIIQPFDAPADDPALRLVADLVGNMEYEDASAIEISTHAGAVDEAVSSLSADERQELQRLLTAEMKRPGD
jgi:hypothetical protein